MKNGTKTWKRIGVTFLIMLGVISGNFLAAQSTGQDSNAIIKTLVGTVGYSTDGVYYLGAKTGMKLPIGATLRTGLGAAVELELGEPVGALRLTENTVLILPQLGEGAVGAEDKQWNLELRSGIVVGFSNHVTRPSMYQFKTPVGLVGVGASQFRIDARGYLVALDGLMIMAQAEAEGSDKIKTHILKAPPSVYFAPGYGVNPSPEPLVQEVLGQITIPLKAGSPPQPEPVEKKSSAKRPAPSQLFDPSLQPQNRMKRRF